METETADIRQRIDMNIVQGRLDRAKTEKYIAAHMAYAASEIDTQTFPLAKQMADCEGITKQIKDFFSSSVGALCQSVE